MTDQQLAWLSASELVLHRMAAFHQHRVEEIASGAVPLAQRDGGIMVVHLIPQRCVEERIRFAASDLKSHGSHISPLGDRGGYSRFNVDGFMNYDGYQGVRAYSQLFRDGRLEAVMGDLAYKQNGHSIIRDSICEQAIFNVVPAYLKFCQAIDLKAPVWMFSALVACEGVRFATDPRWPDLSDHAVDRSPAFLPEIEITSFEIEPKGFLRPWCDFFWQSAGLERSFNYDNSGNWRERR